jgi:hypothetical protein
VAIALNSTSRFGEKIPPIHPTQSSKLGSRYLPAAMRAPVAGNRRAVRKVRAACLRPSSKPQAAGGAIRKGAGHCCISEKSVRSRQKVLAKSIGYFADFRPKRLNATVPFKIGRISPPRTAEGVEKSIFAIYSGHFRAMHFSCFMHKGSARIFFRCHFYGSPKRQE